MNGLTLLNGGGCYLEVRRGTVQALDGERGLELPIERGADGRLTEASRGQVTLKLQEFFKRPPWQPRPRVLCAIGVRGVSLRRLSLPPTTRENLQRVLQLQVEAEFPVSPAELAWGYRQLGGPGNGNGNGGRKDVLVAAIRKEAMEPYAELLANCGLTPVFTVAALARGELCPLGLPAYAVLDVGRNSSELVCFEEGVPTTLRVVPWGGETVTQALSERLQLGRNEAENFKLKLESSPRPNGEIGPKIDDAMESAIGELAAILGGYNLGRKLYLTGKSLRQKELAARLGKRLGPAVECQALEPGVGAGRTAALLGLQQLGRHGETPLILQAKPTNGQAVVARPAPWKWVGIAAGLACLVLVAPYAEAFLFKNHLAGKLARAKRDAGRLTIIDQELSFLEYLKQNQPPYLDTLFLFAKSAPPGVRLDSFTMNRRGELSWRGTLKDSQQVADFRAKLIASGMLANVTVEEQTPVPNRQNLSVRMSAQWKPLSPQQSVALGPTPEEIEKARTNVHQASFGAPMMPGGFPGMEGGPPPGMMPPGMPVPVRRSSRSSSGPGMPTGPVPMSPDSAARPPSGPPNFPPGQPPPGPNNP